MRIEIPDTWIYLPHSSLITWIGLFLALFTGFLLYQIYALKTSPALSSVKPPVCKYNYNAVALTRRLPSYQVNDQKYTCSSYPGHNSYCKCSLCHRDCKNPPSFYSAPKTSYRSRSASNTVFRQQPAQRINFVRKAPCKNIDIDGYCNTCSRSGEQNLRNNKGRANFRNTRANVAPPSFSGCQYSNCTPRTRIVPVDNKHCSLIPDARLCWACSKDNICRHFIGASRLTHPCKVCTDPTCLHYMFKPSASAPSNAN
jgi:hypothetical protein